MISLEENNELTEYISSMVDGIDNLIKYLDDLEVNDQRELRIARQKLEEAVFWITYWLDLNSDGEDLVNGC